MTCRSGLGRSGELCGSAGSFARICSTRERQRSAVASEVRTYSIVL